MEEGDDVSLSLEDEDGYIQCKNLPVSESTIYDSNFARQLSPSPTLVLRRPSSESQQWSMGSRKRSKSLERLSAVSVRPSTSRGGNASGADFSTAPRRRRRGQLEVSPRAVAALAPRIPPRPTDQLLNRFQQQRANLSHPSPATPAAQGKAPALQRKKYVELDVGVKEKGTAGGGRAAGTNSRNSPRLRTEETLGSPRKPRKMSAPNTHIALKQHLSTKAVSLDEQNPSRELVNPEESSASSLHIIDLRSGTTVYRDDSGSPQVQRPPPPLRKPPSRPPAPLPRARKNLPTKPPTTTKITGEPTDLEPYVDMSPADTTKRTSTSQLPNGGTKNTTPLSRELRGQRGERGRGGKERDPTPESEPEDFEAYSYVDLVKNRHLLGRDSQGPEAVGHHPTSNTGGLEDGPLPVYTPLNFSVDGMVDEGGGVYMSPEVTESPSSPEPPSQQDSTVGGTCGSNPVLIIGDTHNGRDEGGQCKVIGTHTFHSLSPFVPVCCVWCHVIHLWCHVILYSGSVSFGKISK
jgi:hypothetical protein